MDNPQAESMFLKGSAGTEPGLLYQLPCEVETLDDPLSGNQPALGREIKFDVFKCIIAKGQFFSIDLGCQQGFLEVALERATGNEIPVSTGHQLVETISLELEHEIEYLGNLAIGLQPVVASRNKQFADIERLAIKRSCTFRAERVFIDDTLNLVQGNLHARLAFHELSTGREVSAHCGRIFRIGTTAADFTKGKICLPGHHILPLQLTSQIHFAVVSGKLCRLHDNPFEVAGCGEREIILSKLR
mgnify:CR=1 FL=1